MWEPALSLTRLQDLSKALARLRRNAVAMRAQLDALCEDARALGAQMEAAQASRPAQRVLHAGSPQRALRYLLQCAGVLLWKVTPIFRTTTAHSRGGQGMRSSSGMG